MGPRDDGGGRRARERAVHARHAIILIYISLLIAIGFGPVVRAIEHQRLVPVGTKRLPRWLAILVVYFVIIGALVGIAALVIPPLVDQAQEPTAAILQVVFQAVVNGRDS